MYIAINSIFCPWSNHSMCGSSRFGISPPSKTEDADAPELISVFPCVSNSALLMTSDGAGWWAGVLKQPQTTVCPLLRLDATQGF